MKTKLAFVACIALLMVATTGCNDSATVSNQDAQATQGSGSDSHAGHNHGAGHHHAESYPEALTELSGYISSIKAAAEAGEIEKAHDPLHEVHHVLVRIGSLAKKAGLSDDDLGKVEKAKEQLMNAFTEVDAPMHGEKGKPFADVADDITAGMDALKALAKE